MITAILDFELFKGKIKMPERIPEIRIPVVLPLTISYLQEAFIPDSSNRHPVLVFEWYKQLTRNTHQYRLKEIKL